MGLLRIRRRHRRQVLGNLRAGPAVGTNAAGNVYDALWRLRVRRTMMRPTGAAASAPANPQSGVRSESLVLHVAQNDQDDSDDDMIWGGDLGGRSSISSRGLHGGGRWGTGRMGRGGFDDFDDDL